MSWTRETWAAKALEEACDRVRQSSEGTRHKAVVSAAGLVADYVAAGCLRREVVVSELTALGVQKGKDPREVTKAIDYSLSKGDAAEAWFPSESTGPRIRKVRWMGQVLSLDTRRPVLEAAPMDQIPILVSAVTPSAVRMTAYGSVKATKGKADDLEWSDLAEAVANPVPWPAGGKDELALWSPTEVENDDRGKRPDGMGSDGIERQRECRVERVWALPLDYDDDTTWSLARVRQWWGDVCYVAHTTAHHQIEKPITSGSKPAGPRGRVILALSRAVSEEEFGLLASWVRRCGRGTVGEQELANPRRLFFLPSRTPQGYEHDANLVDRALDVDAMLEAIRGIERAVTEEASSTAADPAVWAELDKRWDRDTKSERPNRHLTNVCRVLRNDPRWLGRLTYCEFSDQVLLDGAGLTDRMAPRIADWLGTVYQLHAGSDLVREAMLRIADESPIHPVRSYLQGLTWDGAPRLTQLLVRGFGCKNTPDGLTYAIGRRWAISCIARVMAPGCKVDTVLILYGAQGALKSSAFRVLVGDAWFSDSALDLGDMVRAYMGIRGKWVYELAELESLRLRESTTIKSFLSSSVDSYVRKHGRVLEDHPRQVVFVGTTNEEAMLRDPTGSRRFWVRTVEKPIDLAWLRENRDQIWAEAYHLYGKGEQWWLTTEEEDSRREDEWEHVDADAWTEAVLQWCLGRSGVTAADVAVGALKLDLKDVGHREKLRIGGILKAAGWTSKQDRSDKSKGRRWYKEEVR